MAATIGADDPDIRLQAIDHYVVRLPDIGDLGAIRRDLWIPSDLELKYVCIQELTVVCFCR